MSEEKLVGSDKKHVELKEYVINLSSSILTEGRVKAACAAARDLYRKLGSDYRHSYSNLTTTIYKLSEEDIKETNGKSDRIVLLGANLEILKISMQLENDKNDFTVSKFEKLCDHIMLDIRRLEHEMAMREELINVRQQTDLARRELLTLHGKVANAERDSITVLGIFASIVLAFTAGIVFSTSVLANMHLSSTYKVVLVALIVGMVFINLIYILTSFIEKIRFTGNKETQNTNAEKPGPIFWINLMLISLIILDVIAWFKNLPRLVP